MGSSLREWISAIATGCCGVLIGSAASAEEFVQTHNEALCNENGYVLEPNNQMQDKQLENKLLSSNLYLGVSCDSYHRQLGSGSWCWANGGVLVEFSGEVLGLARYELPACPQHSDELACSCTNEPLPGWK